MATTISVKMMRRRSSGTLPMFEKPANAAMGSA
jgi:hypothetical protein